MPRLTRSQPKYCRNRSSGYAHVTIGYRQISLGKFGTPGSKAKYRQVIAEYNANGGHLPSSENASNEVTVAELIDRFGRHADNYPNSSHRAVTDPFVSKGTGTKTASASIANLPSGSLR